VISDTQQFASWLSHFKGNSQLCGQFVHSAIGLLKWLTQHLQQNKLTTDETIFLELLTNNLQIAATTVNTGTLHPFVKPYFTL